MDNSRRPVLYLYVNKNLKKWLKKLSKDQVGATSLSNVVERILSAAKKDPKILKAALGE